ncbi:MAG: hypothetical protein EXQ99_04630 [Alphaproteobacteria bacterium]|nr:hypothetical protein [Alphaproteobacteria bacterium]
MTKLIALVVIVAAIFLAFKYINKVKAERQAAASRGAPSRDSNRRPSWTRRVFKAEVLVECTRCGTFVPSLNDHVCRGKP